ncbi:MAG: DUF5798 family protein [Haloferacaceae archaeon]
MGFGSTAKKLQKVTEMAEKVYGKLKELRTEVDATRETVEETAERTARLEAELAEQRALVDRLLEANGVDPESVDLADAEPPVGGETAADDPGETTGEADETSGDPTTAGAG